jgi:hypothetical protein
MPFLIALTDDETAKLMPEGSNHPSWTDSDSDRRLARQLCDSGGACKTVIDLIEETLRAVEEEAEKLWAHHTEIDTCKLAFTTFVFYFLIVPSPARIYRK